MARTKSPRSRQLSWIASIAVAGLIVFVMWVWFGARGEPPVHEPSVSEAPHTPSTSIEIHGPNAPAEDTNGGGNPAAFSEPPIVPAPPNEPTPAISREADRTFSRGRARLAAADLIGARGLLSEALASGGLAADRAAECRACLTDIAAEVVFGRQLHPGDEHSRRYVVQPGDTLGEIVARENLFVPWQGIQRINRIDDVRRIRPGQWIKLVQGPFDAIVTKHSFTLDLYHRGMFVKSYPIGLGQNGSTPTGRWIVRPGGRVSQAPWTPPAGTGRTGTIEFGQPGYPLGPKGLWIALQGVEPETEILVGFGIHGTNEPDSIGRQASLGCIRLGDEDIDELFGLLYGGKSTVEVRP